MSYLSRVLHVTLPAIGLAGVGFCLASCEAPNSATASISPASHSSSSSATAFSMRQKYGGVSTPRFTAPEVEHTTRESFFAWLFSPSSHGSSSKKKPETKTTGPVIPATQVNSAILARSTKGNTRIVVDVSRQKAYLLVDGTVAIETPVSTARPGKSTPRGTYSITERVRTGKISTIYGVGMPYWMRLGGSVYGVHAGYLPGYPASAGCIRLPQDAAQMIYDHTKHGTRVSIYSSWDGA